MAETEKEQITYAVAAGVMFSALIVMAAAAALVLVWGYAGLPFPGRYTENLEGTVISRLDTWTGEIVLNDKKVLIDAGPGIKAP